MLLESSTENARRASHNRKSLFLLIAVLLLAALSIVASGAPSDPDPADGEIKVVPATLLRWTAGERA